MKLPTIIHCLLGVLFAAFAAFQVNDVDPDVYHEASRVDSISWLIFYGFVALLMFWRATGRRVVFPILLLGALFCIYEMVMTGPGLYDNLFKQEDFTITGAQMAPERSHIELSREFFGAVIALAGLVFIFFQQRFSKNK